MTMTADSTLGDETLRDEIVAYKPISPAATLALVVGIAAAIAAVAVADLGWGFAAVPVIGFLMGLKGLASVRRYDMAGRGAARAALALSTLSLVGGSAAYAYILKTTVPPGYARISYDPLQPGMGGPVPTSAQDLDGKKVYINGYMYPTGEGYGLKGFVLCRDNGTCCFGGQPKLNDMIEVKVKDGRTIDYTSSLRGIGGTFRVRPDKAPGGLGQVVYHIEDADVLH